eukprot:m.20745 g.20745  ORF g.20745 m.20745 type:complete len:386 (+) comp8613_c0_seq2:120-1277(+)
MDHFIDIPDVEQATELASFFVDIVGESLQDEMLDYLDDDDVDGVVRCAIKNLPVVFASQEAIESTLNNMALLATKSEKNSDTLTSEFGAALANTSEEQYPETRLRVLTLLFNCFQPNDPKRYNIFSHIVSVANSTNQMDAILSTLEGDLTPWLKVWGVSEDKVTTLYKLIHSALKDTKNTTLSRSYLKKFLLAFQGKDQSVLDGLKADAVALIGETLLSNDLEVAPLFSLDAIKNIAGSPAYKVLESIYNGDFTAYSSIVSEHSTVAEELGIEKAMLDKRARIMAVAKAVEGRDTITFSELANTVAVQEDEVEAWVVDALCVGAIDATIDDMNNTIHITRVVNSKFDKQNWIDLEAALTQWRANVSSVLGTLHDVREAQNGGDGK